MTGLSKITDKILAEAQEDAAKKLAEADERCEEIARDYAARAEEIRKTLNEDAKREATEIISRAKSGEAMARRNVLLEAKSARIDEAFDLAYQEIMNLSDERYGELLSMLLTSVIKQQTEHEKISRELYGEEDAPEADVYEVLLNEKDRERFGTSLLNSFYQRMGMDDQAIFNRVVISASVVNIDGGLIVRCGSIEINCSLRSLFDQIRPELEAKVSRKLFPDKLEKKGN